MQGIEILSEMSNDELMEEIITFNRKKMAGAEREDLLRTVVNIRLSNFKERLLAEAEIEDPPSVFGMP